MTHTTAIPTARMLLAAALAATAILATPLFMSPAASAATSNSPYISYEGSAGYETDKDGMPVVTKDFDLALSYGGTLLNPASGIAWSSSDTSVATVTNSGKYGKVKLVSPGTCTITAGYKSDNGKQFKRDYTFKVKAVAAKKTATYYSVTYSISGSSAKVTKIKSSVKDATILSKVKIGSKTYKVSGITNSAVKGDRKLKTITVKSTYLTKSGVKGSLKGTTVATVKVPKSKYTAYKSYFAKGNSGKSVKVSKA